MAHEEDNEDYGPDDFESYGHFDHSSKYEPGDLVVLNSGGCAMNVVDTIVDKPICVCCWLDVNEQICSAAIPDACLNYFIHGEDD